MGRKWEIYVEDADGKRHVGEGHLLKEISDHPRNSAAPIEPEPRDAQPGASGPTPTRKKSLLRASTAVFAALSALASVSSTIVATLAYFQTVKYVELTDRLVRRAEEPMLVVNSAQVARDLGPSKKQLDINIELANRGGGIANASVEVVGTIGGRDLPAKNGPHELTITPGTPNTFTVSITDKFYEDVVQGNALIKVTLDPTYTTPEDSTPKHYRWKGYGERNEGTGQLHTEEDRHF